MSEKSEDLRESKGSAFSLPPSPPPKWGPTISKCILLHWGKEMLACERGVDVEREISERERERGEGLGVKEKKLWEAFYFLGFGL